MTIFGAGLLVGTALTVIIPEGIRALYSDLITAQHSHALQRTATAAAGAGAVASATAGVSEAHAAALGGGVSAERTHDDEEAGEYSATIGLSLVLGKGES